MALVFAVPLSPEVANGLALQDEDNKKGHKVCDLCGNDDPANVVESRRNLFREDAEVEQDDRDLGQGNDNLVGILFDVEDL
jgi:hypothetical protein